MDVAAMLQHYQRPPAAAVQIAGGMPAQRQQHLQHMPPQPQQHERKGPATPLAPAPVPPPAATRTQAPMAPYPRGAQAQTQADFDVEAVALSAIGGAGMAGMGIDEDGIMAMALGTLEPPHQDWNMSQASMATSNYHHHHHHHHPAQPYAGYEPFQAAGVASAAYSPPYETRGFGSDTTAYDDAGSAAGSRLFERWAGQGLGGGPASSRLTSFVGGDGAQAGGYANAGANGYGANSAYNGFPEADGSSTNHEPPHMPLGRGARRLMH